MHGCGNAQAKPRLPDGAKEVRLLVEEGRVDDEGARVLRQPRVALEQVDLVRHQSPGRGRHDKVRRGTTCGPTRGDARLACDFICTGGHGNRRVHSQWAAVLVARRIVVRGARAVAALAGLHVLLGHVERHVLELARGGRVREPFALGQVQADVVGELWRERGAGCNKWRVPAARRSIGAPPRRTCVMGRASLGHPAWPSCVLLAGTAAYPCCSAHLSIDCW